MEEKHLEDYLSRLRADDVVEASQEARTKSMAFLNDQEYISVYSPARLVAEIMSGFE